MGLGLRWRLGPGLGLGLGLGRTAVRTLGYAAAVGVLAGGAFGLLAPSFAEARPTVPQPAAHQPTVVLTSAELVAGRLEVTMRFTNPSTVVRRIDPAAIEVTADGVTLPHSGATTAAVEVGPGNRLMETVAFDASSVTKDDRLALTIPGEDAITLEH